MTEATVTEILKDIGDIADKTTTILQLAAGSTAVVSLIAFLICVGSILICWKSVDKVKISAKDGLEIIKDEDKDQDPPRNPKQEELTITRKE